MVSVSCDRILFLQIWKVSGFWSSTSLAHTVFLISLIPYLQNTQAVSAYHKFMSCVRLYGDYVWLVLKAELSYTQQHLCVHFQYLPFTHS